MSAAEIVLHRHFQSLVSEYHPFAKYEGYAECDEGFLVAYRGSGERKYMLVDTDLDVVHDQTVGTTRWANVASFALAGLFLLGGGGQNQRY
ncbi:MAG TPA: hypothetical protein DD379_19685 [Cyanobacteria bacterium UBA11162]|nr:hypothetical protein [Cyanobacteria bacterium UBA11162]